MNSSLVFFLGIVQSYEKIADRMDTSGDFNHSWVDETKTAPQFEEPFPFNLLISFVDVGNLGVPLSGWGISFGSPSRVLPCASPGNLNLR